MYRVLSWIASFLVSGCLMVGSFFIIRVSTRPTCGLNFLNLSPLPYPVGSFQIWKCWCCNFRLPCEFFSSCNPEISHTAVCSSPLTLLTHCRSTLCCCCRIEIHIDVRHIQLSMLFKLVVARCINSALLIYLATKYDDTFGRELLPSSPPFSLTCGTRDRQSLSNAKHFNC
jgi:hypothetical protein